MTYLYYAEVTKTGYQLKYYNNYISIYLLTFQTLVVIVVQRVQNEMLLFFESGHQKVLGQVFVISF